MNAVPIAKDGLPTFRRGYVDRLIDYLLARRRWISNRDLIKRGAARTSASTLLNRKARLGKLVCLQKPGRGCQANPGRFARARNSR